jgi:hypothetical protein
MDMSELCKKCHANKLPAEEVYFGNPMYEWFTVGWSQVDLATVATCRLPSQQGIELSWPQTPNHSTQICSSFSHQGIVNLHVQRARICCQFAAMHAAPACVAPAALNREATALISVFG